MITGLNFWMNADQNEINGNIKKRKRESGIQMIWIKSGVVSEAEEMNAEAWIKSREGWERTEEDHHHADEGGRNGEEEGQF